MVLKILNRCFHVNTRVKERKCLSFLPLLRANGIQKALLREFACKPDILVTPVPKGNVHFPLLPQMELCWGSYMTKHLLKPATLPFGTQTCTYITLVLSWPQKVHPRGCLMRACSQDSLMHHHLQHPAVQLVMTTHSMSEAWAEPAWNLFLAVAPGRMRAGSTTSPWWWYVRSCCDQVGHLFWRSSHNKVQKSQAALVKNVWSNWSCCRWFRLECWYRYRMQIFCHGRNWWELASRSPSKGTNKPMPTHPLFSATSLLIAVAKTLRR